MKDKKMTLLEDLYVTWAERGLWLSAVLWFTCLWWRLRQRLDRLQRLAARILAKRRKPRA